VSASASPGAWGARLQPGTLLITWPSEYLICRDPCWACSVIVRLINAHVVDARSCRRADVRAGQQPVTEQHAEEEHVGPDRVPLLVAELDLPSGEPFSDRDAAS
jgi:hypothetical protein